MGRRRRMRKKASKRRNGEGRIRTGEGGGKRSRLYDSSEMEGRVIVIGPMRHIWTGKG